MDLQLKDKVIMVTGGGKGIGEGIVRVLAKEGAIPVIIGRNLSDNLQLLNELKSHHEIFQVVAELSNPDESEKAVKSVIEKYGCIDGLVNNAGQNDGVGLEQGTYERFMHSLHKNVIHYYLSIHTLNNICKIYSSITIIVI